MRLSVQEESWPLDPPLVIARETLHAVEMVVVEVEDDHGNRGRGEAAGVDYDGETPASMIAQIRAVESNAATFNRIALQNLLPPGGARNALDCALWDLEAKQSGQSVASLTGLVELKPVITAWTIGLGTEAETRAKAAKTVNWPLIKIKLDAAQGLDPVRLIRSICPTSRFIVDPNQGWTVEQLNAWHDELQLLGVEMIEQPVKRGEDVQLARYVGTIPLAADESCTDRASLDMLIGLYQLINIKLDKTGGLTEALELAKAARAKGYGIMVGCMAGTSLAMAAGLVVAQGAEFVDLDGPLLHGTDREHGLHYASNGFVSPPTRELWG
jgi:L-Ala-D/L-Glu epimerase